MNFSEVLNKCPKCGKMAVSSIYHQCSDCRHVWPGGFVFGDKVDGILTGVVASKIHCLGKFPPRQWIEITDGFVPVINLEGECVWVNFKEIRKANYGN